MNQHIIFLNPKRPTAEDMCDVKVVPLAQHALLSYLMSRGIPIEVGTKYCQEVHYTIYARENFGLCFPNIVGGMEIMNVYFKGCYGVKAPSVIPIEKHKHTQACCVFEGFMDFLSYIVLSTSGRSEVIQLEPCDCIVLNSTSIVHKALPFIKVYQQAYCYLDNDSAGETAYLEIKEAMNGNAKNCCAMYAEYNDLNDYLLGKKRRR